MQKNRKSNINKGFIYLINNNLSLLITCFFIVVIFLLIFYGGSNLSYNWQWYRIPRLLLPGWQNDVWTWGPLVKGLYLTFILSIFSVPLATAIGLFLAILEKSKLFALRFISRSYIELIRNTPLLVQLYLLYFMFANFFDIDRVTSGILALAIFEAAFAAEIFRAGLDAISKGQQDAAKALGLKPLQAFRLIYIPQSLPLILPSLANLFVSLIKHSSIVSVVALPELTDIARNIIADTYLTFEIWLVVAAVYITLCFSFSLAIKLWESRLLARVNNSTIKQ